MPKPIQTLIYGRLLLLAAALVALALLIGRHLAVSWNVLLAVMGFSAVVFIHECGHFLLAKAVNIKVEVFSIFLPPVLLGIRRTQSGYRVRLLPKFFPKDDDPEGDGLLSFTFGRPGRPGETEYRIGLVPVAGYVKMLGQEDLGADKQSHDPRSFGNKSIPARMAVIAAGVLFNVLSAVVIMTVVYLIGIRFASPVVSDVLPGSAAEKAGLQAGDRIVEVAGIHDGLQPDDILAAAVLSDPGEAVPMAVQKRDGTMVRLSLVAAKSSDLPVRLFGIEFDQPQSLTVAAVEEQDVLFETCGLKVGDRVVAVNGEPISQHWQFNEAIEKNYVARATLTVDRPDPAGRIGRVDVAVPTVLIHLAEGATSPADLSHVASLIPRLRISGTTEPQSPLRPGDIILAVGDVNDPTFDELREVVNAHDNKDLVMRVVRADPNGAERNLLVTVRPKRSRGSDRALIGIIPALDAMHPVVAKVIDVNGVEPLPVPRGATLTSVAGQPVANFYDVIRGLRARTGQRTEIQWVAPDQKSGSAWVTLQDPQKEITARVALAAIIPFEPLKELHKARTLGQAMSMASTRSVRFVVQTYITVKQLVYRGVSLNAMSGPVGIASLTYQVAKRSFVDFLYLLAFISANLAVMNFLPLPVVDGGVFVLLIVERIKGSPLSIRMQEVITYIGLAFIVSLFLYLTYNDIVRLISG